MPGVSGWTAASLVPPHQVAAALSGGPQPLLNTAAPGVTGHLQPGTGQTFTPGSVTLPDVSANRDAILKQILGPNYQLGTNPSPIAGSAALFSPNYLAQVQKNTVPTPGANGFTNFGGAYWKMPPVAPKNSEAIPGVNSNAFAPSATSTGQPSGWTPNQQNLFNI